jgi:muramidase (phage lysozyme)
MITQNDLRKAFQHPNVRAFYMVVRKGESSLDDKAYTMVNGRAPLTDFSRHPFAGLKTTQGGRAAGAPQFIPSTWGELADKYGFTSFTPEEQDLGYVGCLLKRDALADVVAGNFDQALRKCRPEWTSLPGASESQAGWDLDKARALYAQYGGTFGTAQTQSEPQSQPPKEEKSMAPLMLLSAFAPILQGLLPQVAALFDPTKKVAERNLGIAQVVIDTIVQETGKANLPEAVGAMTDPTTGPEITKRVQEAIVTQPEIMQVLEIGGGIAKSREFSTTVQNAEKPFWYNPTFWITAMFFPMMYMITYQVLFTFAGPVMIGTGVENAPLVATSWYAQIGFDSNTRTGLVNLIVGFVFGGICGIWFGTTVARQKEQAAATTQVINDRRQL